MRRSVSHRLIPSIIIYQTVSAPPRMAEERIDSMSAVRRHPLITFFVLTYAIAWGFLPFGSFGAFAPLIAALIVIPLTQGRAGLRELGSRMIR